MLDILKENGRKVRSHYLYPMFVQLGDDNDFDGMLCMIRSFNNPSLHFLIDSGPLVCKCHLLIYIFVYFYFALSSFHSFFISS